jgi:hypothetical protein
MISISLRRIAKPLYGTYTDFEGKCGVIVVSLDVDEEEEKFMSTVDILSILWVVGLGAQPAGNRSRLGHRFQTHIII